MFGRFIDDEKDVIGTVLYQSGSAQPTQPVYASPDIIYEAKPTRMIQKAALFL